MLIAEEFVTEKDKPPKMFHELTVAQQMNKIRQVELSKAYLTYAALKGIFKKGVQENTPGSI